MTDGGEACPPFLEGFSSCCGQRSSFKLKNLQFQDQTEPFPYSFQGFALARYAQLVDVDVTQNIVFSRWDLFQKSWGRKQRLHLRDLVIRQIESQRYWAHDPTLKGATWSGTLCMTGIFSSSYASSPASDPDKLSH
jgi:hypothetical protein